jgi:hypothetical protein
MFNNLNRELDEYAGSGVVYNPQQLLRLADGVAAEVGVRAESVAAPY